MSDNQLTIEEQVDQLRHYLLQDDMPQFRAHFFELHVYEQGQFYKELTAEERQQVYTYLSPKELADVFDVIEEEDEEIQHYIIEMRPSYAADMLHEMYTDNAVDIFNQLDKTTVTHLLGLMDRESADEIRALLHYEDETAGAIMAKEYVAIVANQTVRSAMYVLKQEAKEAETIYYVYVVDQEDVLVGVISLRDLLVNEDDVMIADIMNERIIAVKVTDDQEDVAKTIRDYDFLAVPVVDDENCLLGIVTVDDIIDVIDDEAASDYSGLAGVNVEETSENPFVSATKRLPWLIILLFLGMSTASLISHYEELVSKASILAVFISLITGTAGNAGTQSLAVAVRRLAISDNKKGEFARLIIREIFTGMVTGAVTGVTIFLIVGVWQHSFTLGFVIGASMFCAITVANLAGSLIPLVMDKIGVDPAVASGPFITTLSDLTSVLIYFNIASIFLNQFLNH